MPQLILFSISIALISFLPELPAVEWLFLVFIILGLLAVKTQYFTFLFIPLGVTYATVAGYGLLAQQIPDALDGADVVVTGQVIGLPVKKADTLRFELIVNHATAYDGKKIPTIDFLSHKKLSISYNEKYNHKYPMVLERFIPGQYLQLRLKLRKPRGFVNPVGFDYQLYLLRKGFAATAYIKSDPLNRALSSVESSSFSIKRDQLRLRFRDFVSEQSALYPESAGALLALMTGDKQLISDAQWELFKNTGTIHLMVISGLHIGLIAFIGFTLGRVFIKTFVLFTGSTSHYLLLIFPSFLSILFASTYAAIAGFGLPTQRALVMVCVFHLAYCLRTQAKPWLAFCLALTIVLMLDPLAAHTPGFWLSFGAAGILLFSFKGFENSTQQPLVKRTLRQWLKSQWVLLIGLGVPSIVLLGGVSSSGFVSNFIAIPMVSFIVVPLVLLSAALVFVFEPAAVIVFQWAQVSFSVLLWCLRAINDVLPSFMHYHNTLSFMAIVLGVVGACFLLAPGLAYRYIALFCFLPIIFVPQQTPFLRLSFLDVGQGTAIVIETENHKMIYDTGKKYSEQFDSGSDIVAPYLSSLGYQTVDTIMISHGDNDHAGGLKGLLELVSVNRLLVGETKKTKGEQCSAGQAWQWDGITFEVLWPTQDYIEAMRVKPVYYKSNNISCVLLIKAGTRSVLLAGDIDRSIEKRIIRRLEKEQGIDIVLAPHHGSKTSSGMEWVNILQPQYVVFTAGYKNAYGHPHYSVIERYRAIGAQTLNTAKEGAIRLSLASYQQAWQLERWRYDHKRYWH